ncbi:MAG TPA: DUF5335 family protein [Gemmataceae bacterium]|jgi:hypothetical protein
MATATTREIPKDQWQAFFNEFSKGHENRRVTIEVLGRNLGDQEAAASLPLLGISYDSKGTGAGRIDVGTGDRPERLVSQVVDRPRVVRVANLGRAEADIEIEDEDGRTTLVRVRNG